LLYFYSQRCFFVLSGIPPTSLPFFYLCPMPCLFFLAFSRHGFEYYQPSAPIVIFSLGVTRSPFPSPFLSAFEFACLLNRSSLFCIPSVVVVMLSSLVQKCPPCELLWYAFLRPPTFTDVHPVCLLTCRVPFSDTRKRFLFPRPVRPPRPALWTIPLLLAYFRHTKATLLPFGAN